MTMVQGSSALRSVPTLLHGASSGCLVSAMAKTMAEAAEKFNVVAREIKNSSLDTAILCKIFARKHENKNHHHPKKSRC
jgi:hypothetical protein